MTDFLDSGIRTSKPAPASFQVTSALTFLAPPSAGAPWPGMPAAQTELFGVSANEVLWKAPDSGNRNPANVLLDIGNTKMCVNVLTPGAAGSTLKAQIFNGAVWEDTSLPVPIDVAGVFVSVPFPGIFNFPSDITQGGFWLLRVVGNNGDGVATPVFGTISLAIGSQFVSLTG